MRSGLLKTVWTCYNSDHTTDKTRRDSLVGRWCERDIIEKTAAEKKQFINNHTTYLTKACSLQGSQVNTMRVYVFVNAELLREKMRING